MKVAAFAVTLLVLAPCLLRGQGNPPANHVILITLDGVRHQDLFGGADSILMASPKSAGISDTTRFRERWWRPTAAERRRLVMPFLWDSLVPLGAMYGSNPEHPVLSTNGLKFSAPGYMEIFTGRPQPSVTSNDDRRYPLRTIFDAVRSTPLAGKPAPRTDVAAFVSWDVQGRLVSADSTTGIVTAALDPLPPEVRLGSGALLESLQSRIGYPVGGMRYDAITHTLALEYLLRFRPRLLHIGLGETDEDAHHGQYPRVLGDLRVVDDELRELWRAINADPELRGRTTIIITADHGRGSTPADWNDHGQKVVGAERIWIFAVGAGIPSRGLVTEDGAVQGSAGATSLYLLGINPATLGEGIAPPLNGIPPSVKLKEVDFLALLSAAICVALGLASHNALNPDGVSYLDLAARLRAADWQHFVQGYWSPLYPAIIAVGAAISRSEGHALIEMVHVLNTLIALLGVGVVWWGTRRGDNPLFGRAAFALLLVSSARAPRLEAVTPDLLLVALVALIGFELLLFQGRRWVRLGLWMGLAFLVKTSMWPWLIVAVLVRLAAGRSRDERIESLRSAAVCVAVMLVWIIPLSIKSGTITFGSAARLNACWYMRECDSRSPDTHTGGHTKYQAVAIGGAEATVAVLTGTPWTYSPWSDPTEWATGVTSYGGIAPSFEQHVVYGLKQAAIVLIVWMWHVWLLILPPVVWLTRRRGLLRELTNERRDALIVTLLGLLGLLQFVAVHVEPRLIAPFVLLFGLGLLAWLTRFGAPKADAIVPRGNRYLVLALSWVGMIAVLPRAWVHGVDQLDIATVTASREQMILSSEASRVPPRTGPRRIAVIGEVFPLLNEAYRLGGTVEWQVLRPRPGAVMAWPPEQQQALVYWLASQGATEAWLNKGNGAFSILPLPLP